MKSVVSLPDRTMNKKEELWEQLYVSHYHKVYLFFLQRLGSTQDAADASQETFYRVVRSKKAQTLTSPAGYLWRTAQNLFREILRGSNTRQFPVLFSQAPGGDDYACPLPDPEETISQKQTRDAVLDIVESLPPRCRQVFIMHRFQGFSHDQISAELGISRKTVENHMVNALLFLRNHLSIK